MRAPVYRHIEGGSTIAGLGVNTFMLLLAVAFGAIQLLSFSMSVAAIAGAYLALRLGSAGKPPLYWQHLIVLSVRQRFTGGRLSAAARCHAPQFPFGPYASRDLRRDER